MNDIRIYVEYLFQGRVMTPETIELKEEIYGNLMARYEDYLASGMSEAEALEKTKASITSVSGLLDGEGAQDAAAGQGAAAQQSAQAAQVSQPGWPAQTAQPAQTSAQPSHAAPDTGTAGAAAPAGTAGAVGGVSTTGGTASAAAAGTPANDGATAGAEGDGGEKKRKTWPVVLAVVVVAVLLVCGIAVWVVDEVLDLDDQLEQQYYESTAASSASDEADSASTSADAGDSASIDDADADSDLSTSADDAGTGTDADAGTSSTDASTAATSDSELYAQLLDDGAAELLQGFGALALDDEQLADLVAALPLGAYADSVSVDVDGGTISIDYVAVSDNLDDDVVEQALVYDVVVLLCATSADSIVVTLNEDDDPVNDYDAWRFERADVEDVLARYGAEVDALDSSCFAEQDAWDELREVAMSEQVVEAIEDRAEID